MHQHVFGIPYSPNCQDILSEAISEWGLGPLSTHDSFNCFMKTWLDPRGRRIIGKSNARQGDFIEMLAQTDLLAVGASCGSCFGNDYTNSDLNITIYEATEAQRNAWLLPESDARIADRPELAAGSGVAPVHKQNHAHSWPWLPLKRLEIDVSLSAAEMSYLDSLARAGEMGDDRPEVLRAVFLTWWADIYLLSKRQL
jgi:hypothetical protein